MNERRRRRGGGGRGRGRGGKGEKAELERRQDGEDETKRDLSWKAKFTVWLLVKKKIRC